MVMSPNSGRPGSSFARPAQSMLDTHLDLERRLRGVHGASLAKTPPHDEKEEMMKGKGISPTLN
jgi:hypothetical protein